MNLPTGTMVGAGAAALRQHLMGTSLEALAHAAYLAMEEQRIAEIPKPPEPLAVGSLLDLTGYGEVLIPALDYWDIGSADETPPGWGGKLAVHSRDAVDATFGDVLITANHLPTPIRTPDGLDRHWETGALALKGHQFRYGYFEADIFLDIGNGGHAAFWLIDPKDPGDERGWEGEIDIIEYLGHWDKDMVIYDRKLATWEQAVRRAATQGRTPPAKPTTGENQWDQYHTAAHWNFGKGEAGGRILGGPDMRINNHTHRYGMEWTKDLISWFLDGVCVRSIPNPGVHVPMHLVINLAIGSTWSLQKFGGATGVLDPADFPMTMRASNVRVLQKAV